jgi:chitinase
MAYDFAGSWAPKTGHHAQLYSGNDGEPSASAAVSYLRSIGFPSKKILLGVPVYGRSFLGASGPGEVYNGHGGEDETFEYKVLPRPGAHEVVDLSRVAAFCTGGDGGFITYDNPETVKLKGEFCESQQLGVSQINFLR